MANNNITELTQTKAAPQDIVCKVTGEEQTKSRQATLISIEKYPAIIKRKIVLHLIPGTFLKINITRFKYPLADILKIAFCFQLLSGIFIRWNLTYVVI